MPDSSPKEAATKPFDVQAFWRDWFDWDCVCGCPHPKPGNSAQPPQVVERDGVMYELPHYPGIIGGDFPVPGRDEAKAADWRCAVQRSHGICGAGLTPPTDLERHLIAIENRFASLRESQSKLGLATSSRRNRALQRHAVERELARQDIPWLIQALRSLLSSVLPTPKVKP